MKAASNLIMWLAMVLLVTLAMVLGLVLLLLVELYCSPLIRRRRNRRQAITTGNNLQPTTTGNNSDGHSDASRSPLDSLTTPIDTSDDIEKQLHRPPENQDSGRTQQQDKSGQVKVEVRKGCSGDSVNGYPFVYISNPIYDDGNGRGSRVADDDDDKTPFETPDTSPSRLETEDCSGDEEISSTTPPLTPMKKLPAMACSVALEDGRLVGSWGSDSNSNNGVSSSLSSTPYTSPSL